MKRSTPSGRSRYLRQRSRRCLNALDDKNLTPFGKTRQSPEKSEQMAWRTANQVYTTGLSRVQPPGHKGSGRNAVTSTEPDPSLTMPEHAPVEFVSITMAVIYGPRAAEVLGLPRRPNPCAGPRPSPRES